MDNSASKSNPTKALLEVSSALFELRDALVELSLSIKDWQFDTHQEQRKNAENDVFILLQKLSAAQGPRA